MLQLEDCAFSDTKSIQIKESTQRISFYWRKEIVIKLRIVRIFCQVNIRLTTAVISYNMIQSVTWWWWTGGFNILTTIILFKQSDKVVWHVENKLFCFQVINIPSLPSIICVCLQSVDAEQRWWWVDIVAERVDIWHLAQYTEWSNVSIIRSGHKIMTDH